MRNYLNLTLAILMIAITPTLMGIDSCNDEPADDDAPVTAEPADIGTLIKAGGAVAIGIIDVIEAAATLNEQPQFDPCMIADGSKAGIAIAESNVDAIVAEAADPDGKIHLMGGPVVFDRCMTMEGKPDPWPPTKPNVQVEAAIKTFVPAGALLVKASIEPNLPTSGQKCIEGQIAMSMMDSISVLVTTTVIDGVNGKDGTEIPEFDVDYAGCGLDFTTPEEPVEEPAADDDSAE